MKLTWSITEKMGLMKAVHHFLLIFGGNLLDSAGGQESCPQGCNACNDGILECINFAPFTQTDVGYLKTVQQITEAYLWSNPRVEPHYPWSEAVKNSNEQILHQRHVIKDPQSEKSLSWSEAVGNHTKNFIRVIQKGLFFELGITHVTEDDFNLFRAISNMGLAYNNIQRIYGDVFPKTLTILDLSYNKIQKIDQGTLPPKLEELNLSNNELGQIDVLPSGLSLLNLASNAIENLYPDVLSPNLSTLVLFSNRITSIKKGELPENLQKLILGKNDLRNIGKGALPHSLEYVSADKYFVCCFVKENSECIAPTSPFATCDGLLQHWGYRVSAWILSVVASVTNLIALSGQVINKNKLKDKFVPTVKTNTNVFLASLAFSDFLMGIYLLSIAVADTWFGSDYFTVYSKAWQTGALCEMIRIIGTLSVIGSLFTLTAMAIDRFIWIVPPKGKTCFNRIWADTVCAIIWVLGTLVAILPLLLSEKFKDFYEHSDVCLTLPIAVTPKPVARGFDWQNRLHLLPGYTVFMEGAVWAYSLVIYTCLSSVCVLIASLCYTVSLASALLSKEKAFPKDWRNQDFQLAIRISIIVAINVLCWLCVIILTVLSQLNIVTPNMVNPLLVLLVLPLKSALNPLVYCYGNILKCPKPRMVLKISLVRRGSHNSANLTAPGDDPVTR